MLSTHPLRTFSVRRPRSVFFSFELLKRFLFLTQSKREMVLTWKGRAQCALPQIPHPMWEHKKTNMLYLFPCNSHKDNQRQQAEAHYAVSDWGDNVGNIGKTIGVARHKYSEDIFRHNNNPNYPSTVCKIE